MLSIIGVGVLIILAGVELGLILSFAGPDSEPYDWVIVIVCAPGLVVVAGILSWVVGTSL